MDIMSFLESMRILESAPRVAQAIRDGLENEFNRMLRGDPRVNGSTLCLATGSTILFPMRLSLGFEKPDTGDRLVDSGSRFDEVGGHIADLVPSGGWQGSAAEAYLARDLAQARRAELMGELDQLTGGLVSSQAEAITEVRGLLDRLIGLSFAWMLFCFGMETTPPGRAISFISAVLVCSAAIAAAADGLNDLKVREHTNSGSLQALHQRLTALMADLSALPDTIPGLRGAIPPPSDLPEFDLAFHNVANAATAVAGGSDAAAPLSETPDISLALKDLPGSPEFSVPDLPSPGFPDFGAPNLPIPQLGGVPNPPRLAGSPGVADLFGGPGGVHSTTAVNELAALLDFSDALAAVPSLGLANVSAVAQPAAPPSQDPGLSSAPSGFSQPTTMTGDRAQMTSAAVPQGASQHGTPADREAQPTGTSAVDAETPDSERAPAHAGTEPVSRRRQHAL